MEFTIINSYNRDLFEPFLSAPPNETNGVSFGLTLGGAPCGGALVTIGENLATLQYFFIAADCRRMGCGTFFMSKIRQHLQLYGILHMVCHPAYQPWDEMYHLKFFLTHCGFQEGDTVAWIYTMTLHAFSKPVTDSKNNIVPLSHFPQAHWQSILQRGHLPASCNQVDHPDFAPDLTMVVVEHDAIPGILVVHRKDDLQIEVAGLHYSGNDATTVKRLMDCAIANAATLLPPETQVTYMINNPKLQSVMGRILSKISHSKQDVVRFYT
ncbi:MAG: hypothetical protein R3Y62_06255 [Eubacteriales bacterium]